MEIMINYWAVLASTVAVMVIGMAWYSPMVFGKMWMASSGLSETRMAEMKAGGMGKKYFANLIAAFLMAYVLAHFARLWGVMDVWGALQLAFWTWLGFAATILLGPVLWEGKLIKLYLVNSAYYLVSLSVMSVILAWWV